jgi:exodeoxyribonuclease VII large subunit
MMNQASIFSTIHWSVTDLTRRIREQLETDEMLQDVWVEGEISNLSRPGSGHVYFTLKDASASLRCVMWKGEALRLKLQIKDGMAVEVHGRISVYDAGGQYQLYSDQIRAIGAGALYQEFLRLKGQLEKEGVFASERKRPIPDFPLLIGVITSASGAAWRDILNTLQRRQPLATVILAHSPVQGEGAATALIQALGSVNARKPDVILLARGGGSIEDLWAFNEEALVRAVAASDAPVICGVGHETDFTLCDFAADLRAATPTASAELATPITRDGLFREINDRRNSLTTLMSEFILTARESLHGVINRLQLLSPTNRVYNEIQKLDELSRRTESAVAHFFQYHSLQIDGYSKRLTALNPIGVLSRGYAILTRKDDGHVVASVKDATRDMMVRVRDGEFGVTKV